ncbi:reverse transcriptase family protein, partial [bacterium]|nr:reverse transcriptase family protein [bacterium]
MKVDFFVNGLRPKIGKKVSEKKPENLEKAIKMAKELQIIEEKFDRNMKSHSVHAISKSDDKKKTTWKSKMATSNAPTPKPTEACRRFCNYCKASGHTEEFCWKKRDDESGKRGEGSQSVGGRGRTFRARGNGNRFNWQRSDVRPWRQGSMTQSFPQQQQQQQQLVPFQPMTTYAFQPPNQQITAQLPQMQSIPNQLMLPSTVAMQPTSGVTVQASTSIQSPPATNTTRVGELDIKAIDYNQPENVKQLFVDIEIERRPVRAMLDSGATISVITKKFIDELNETKKLEIVQTIQSLTGFGSSHLNPDGKVQLDAHIGNQTKPVWFFIVDGPEDQIILGMNVWKQFNLLVSCDGIQTSNPSNAPRSYDIEEVDAITLDVHTLKEDWGFTELELKSIEEELTTFEEEITLINEKIQSIENEMQRAMTTFVMTICTGQNEFLTLRQKKVLPPRSKNIIELFVPKWMKNGTNLMIEDLQQPDQKFLVPRSIHVVHQNRIIIEIVNPAERSVTIKPNRPIVRFEELDEERLKIYLVGLEEDEEEMQHANTSSFTVTDEEIESLLKRCDPDLSPVQLDEVRRLIKRNADMFSTKLNKPGCSHTVPHEIDTEDNKPVHQMPYRVSEKENEFVKTKIEEMLQTGAIRPSKSPWASPIVLAPKKDGTLRFCVDYRKLNDLTKRDTYPLPRIDDILAAIHGKPYKSTLDAVSGYWQIAMADNSKEKTAFISRWGLFEWNVMPFGLKNAPAAFQRVMDVVLAGINWITALVYIDDIVVMSCTFDEHLTDLQDVFDRLKKANIQLNIRKCSLFRTEIEFL